MARTRNATVRGRGRGRPRRQAPLPQESQTMEASMHSESSQRASQRESRSPSHRSESSQRQPAEPVWLAPLMARLSTAPATHRSPVDKLRKYGAYDFSGDENEGAEEADEWLFKTRNVLKMLKCSEEEKMLCIMTLLKGVALEWWETMLETAPDDLQSWDYFVEQFDQRFMGEFYKTEMRRQFLELKQGNKSVQEYNRVFTKLLRHAGGIVQNEKEKCLQFINGLNLELQKGLIVGPKDNVSTIMNDALTLERVENARVRQSERSKGKREATSAPAGYGGSSPKKLRGQMISARSQAGSTGLYPRPTPSSNRQDVPRAVSTASGGKSTKRTNYPECNFCGKMHPGECWLKSGKCFRCGEPGHQIRECPTPQGQERTTTPTRSTPSVVHASRQGRTENRSAQPLRSRRETGNRSEARTTGRFYALGGQEVHEDDDIVEGKSSV